MVTVQVLGLAYRGKFGSLGLSRRSSLMDKPLQFSSLADLITEFQRAYAGCGHTVLKVGLIHEGTYLNSKVKRKGGLVTYRIYPWRLKTAGWCRCGWASW